MSDMNLAVSIFLYALFFIAAASVGRILGAASVRPVAYIWRIASAAFLGIALCVSLLYAGMNEGLGHPRSEERLVSGHTYAVIGVLKEVVRGPIKTLLLFDRDTHEILIWEMKNIPSPIFRVEGDGAERRLVPVGAPFSAAPEEKI